jgi:hypothetical protein
METIQTIEPETIPHCVCGACRGSANFGPGFSVSGGNFRPNVQRAVEAWERAMLHWLDTPEGWSKDYAAKEVLRLHEVLMDYGVDHHSTLACSMTKEEAEAWWREHGNRTGPERRLE